MPKNLTLRGAIEEVLIEVVSILVNFAEKVGDILASLAKNKKFDHENDAIRTEVMGFLLKAIEAYDAKDYEGMQKYIHAAMQKLNQQGVVDVQDDQFRSEAEIKLLKVQISAVEAKERITKLIAKLGKKNASNNH